MKKCDHYNATYEIVGWVNEDTPVLNEISRCYRNNKRNECSCGGDRSKCNFYPEAREKSKKEIQMSLLSYSNDNAVSVNPDSHETVIIETDKLKLYHKDLDIEVCITDDVLRKIENIIINGHKFVREN